MWDVEEVMNCIQYLCILQSYGFIVVVVVAIAHIFFRNLFMILVVLFIFDIDAHNDKW